jgi:hypothetical protein
MTLEMTSKGPVLRYTGIPAVLAAAHTNGFGFDFDLENKVSFAIVSMAPADPANILSTPSWIGNREFSLAVRDATRSNTFELDDCLGRRYLKLHVIEWEMIPIILRYVAQRGDMRFSLTGNMRANRALDTLDADAPFDLRRFELTLIADMRREATSRQQAELWVKSAHKKHYNWTTPEGKQWCSELRALLGVKEFCNPRKAYFYFNGLDGSCKEHQIWHHGIWSKFTPTFRTVDEPLDSVVVDTPAASASTVDPLEHLDKLMDRLQRQPSPPPPPLLSTTTAINEVVATSSRRRKRKANDVGASAAAITVAKNAAAALGLSAPKKKVDSATVAVAIDEGGGVDDDDDVVEVINPPDKVALTIASAVAASNRAEEAAKKAQEFSAICMEAAANAAAQKVFAETAAQEAKRALNDAIRANLARKPSSGSSSSAGGAAAAAESNENICMFCLDRPADTMIMPCMHQVLCNECVQKLRGTQHVEKCIFCRGIIEEIASDQL